MADHALKDGIDFCAIAPPRALMDQPVGKVSYSLFIGLISGAVLLSYSRLSNMTFTRMYYYSIHL